MKTPAEAGRELAQERRRNGFSLTPTQVEGAARILAAVEPTPLADTG